MVNPLKLGFVTITGRANDCTNPKGPDPSSSPKATPKCNTTTPDEARTSTSNPECLGNGWLQPSTLLNYGSTQKEPNYEPPEGWGRSIQLRYNGTDFLHVHV